MPRTEGDAKEAKDTKADTTSSTTTSQPAETEKAPKILTRKMYYLSCLACRWTSRDAGLPDQTNGKYLTAHFGMDHSLFVIVF